MAPSLLSFLALATGAAATRASGYLVAYSGGQRVGCVRSNGRVSTGNCANFTLTDDYKLILSPQSHCRVMDEREPLNPDANYGPGIKPYALGCGPQYVTPDQVPTSLFYLAPVGDHVLCTLNLQCSFDLKSAPTADGVPAWPFFTTSTITQVPPGHILATLEFRDTTA